MVAATDYLENRILQEWLGDTPTYVGLWSADPGDNPATPTGSQVEISGGGYVRKPAQWTIQGGTATLASDLTWTNMPACVVGAVVIYDAPTGGNALIRGPLVAAKTVGAGDAFTTPAANITVSVD